MTVHARSQIKPELLRSESCSSAEINKVTTGDKLKPNIDSKRRISFNCQVMVRSIEHVNDKCESEIKSAWYQNEEYREIKTSLAATVRKISSGKFTGDSESDCARGLESKTAFGSQFRKKNKLDALVAVLDEQDRQFDEQYVDDDMLAHLYREVSQRCLEDAQRRGELDELEAKRIHKGLPSMSSLMYNCTEQKENDDSGKPRKGIRRLFKKFDKGRSQP